MISHFNCFLLHFISFLSFILNFILSAFIFIVSLHSLLNYLVIVFTRLMFFVEIGIVMQYMNHHSKQWVNLSGEKGFTWITETHFASICVFTITLTTLHLSIFQVLNVFQNILISGRPLKYFRSTHTFVLWDINHLLMILQGFHLLSHIKFDLYKILIGIWSMG